MLSFAAMIRATLFLLMCAGPMLGCGGYKSPGEKLQESVLRYNDAMRWRRFEVASEYLPTAKREDFMDRQREQADRIRILEYDIDDVHQTVPNEKAEVVVKVKWLVSPSNIVQTIRVRQNWDYTAEKQWQLESAEEVKKKAKPAGPAIPF